MATAAAVAPPPPPAAPFATAMTLSGQARSLPSSPRSSFSSLSPPPSVNLNLTHRPPSRSSLYPSRSSPTLPALAEDSIASVEPLPMTVRPLSVLIDDALRADALSPVKAPDHVDHLNSADPFGALWHNESPYDAALPLTPTFGSRSRPGSMIFPSDPYSGTFPRSRRNSVLAPSPLSQTTSAASFHSPSQVSLLGTPSPLPQHRQRRISIIMGDPADEYPVTKEELLFAHVQLAKQERRDALLRQKEQEAHERAIRLAEEEHRRKKGWFGLFRRKPRVDAVDAKAAAKEEKAKEKEKKKEKKEKSKSKKQQAEAKPAPSPAATPTAPQPAPAQAAPTQEDATPKRKPTRSFSILSRKGTAKLKRKGSQGKPLMPANAAAIAAAAASATSSAATLTSSEQPVPPEYKTTPFDPATASPPHSLPSEVERRDVPLRTPTRSPAPAYALVDPAAVPLPPSPEEELPEPTLLPPPATVQPRPSLPSLQHPSRDSSEPSEPTYGEPDGDAGDGDTESSEAVLTPDIMPGTPLEAKGEYMPMSSVGRGEGEGEGARVRVEKVEERGGEEVGVVA